MSRISSHNVNARPPDRTLAEASHIPRYNIETSSTGVGSANAHLPAFDHYRDRLSYLLIGLAQRHLADISIVINTP